MNQTIQRKKHKHKKNKQKSGDTPQHESHNDSNSDLLSSREHEKKHKKQKRHDDDKERRKKKKDKKKKKQRHSPDPHMVLGTDGPMSNSSTVTGSSSLNNGLSSMNQLTQNTSTNGLNGSIGGRPL